MKNSSSEVLSYNQLSDYVSYTNGIIESLKLEASDVILIVLKNSVSFVVWVLSCLLSKVKFLTIDEKNHRLTQLLRELPQLLPIKCVVTSPICYYENFRFSPFCNCHPHLIIVNAMSKIVYKVAQSLAYMIPSLSSNHLSSISSSLFITCTSGSTAKGKMATSLVLQSLTGIIKRLQWMHSELMREKLNRQVDSYSIVCFAASGFIDCLTTLLDSIINHITYILMDENCIDNPSNVYEWLTSGVIDCIRCTPSFLQALLYDKQPINYPITLYLSGEILTLSSFRYIKSSFPFSPIFNIYGASETSGDCFIFDCMSYDFATTDYDTLSSLPIGRPIPGCCYEIRSIKNDGIEKEELVISGDILCINYWSDISSGQMKEFVSGDLCILQQYVKRNHNQKRISVEEIVVIGRDIESDMVFKVNGVRYSKTDVQKLFEECPLITHAWIEIINEELCAVFLQATHIHGVVTTELVREWLRDSHPLFSIPWKAVFTPSFPYKVGKLNRTEIEHFFLSHYNSVKINRNEETLDNRNVMQYDTITIDSIIHLFSKIIGVEVKENSDFYVFGGDSLKSMILIESLNVRIEDLSRHLSISDLINNSTPRSLYNYIMKLNTPLSNNVISIPPTSIRKYTNIRTSTSNKSLIIVAQIPFRRCVDSDGVILSDSSFCYCCHGGLFKRITLKNTPKGYIVDYCICIDERVEKSLAIIREKTIVAGTYSGSILFIDANDGEILERVTVGGELRSPMACSDDIGVICSYNGYVYIFELSQYTLISALLLNIQCHASPLVVKDSISTDYHIILCSISGDVIHIIVHRNEAKSAIDSLSSLYQINIKWKISLGIPIFADAVIYRNSFLIVDVSGNVHFLTNSGCDNNRLTISSNAEKGSVFYEKPVFIETDIAYFSSTSGQVLRVNLFHGSVDEIITVSLGDCKYYRIKYYLTDITRILMISSEELICCSSSGKVFSIEGDRPATVCLVYDVNKPIFSNPIRLGNNICFGTRGDTVMVCKFT